LVRALFAAALGALLDWWSRARAAAAERARGRLEAERAAERRAAGIQQDIADAVSTPPADRPDLVDRARRGGL
jgi:hypothetical protein